MMPRSQRRALGRLALLGLGGVATWLWFMRDPPRRAPADRDAVVAPADGRVSRVGVAPVPRQAAPWLGSEALRIVILLALWDVHVQRAPVGGTVIAAWDASGPRLPVLLPSAAANAGHWLVLEEDRGRAAVHRQAGALARRVTTTVTPNAGVAVGERVGRILLGSRCELYLPTDAVPTVGVGEQVRAGESVVARWGGPGSATS